MAMLRSNFPDLMQAKGYWNAVITEAQNNYPPGAWEKLFQKKTSTKQNEKFSEVVGLGIMTETGEYEDAVADAMIQGNDTTLTPKSYTKLLTISREAWDDEQYGVFKRYASMMTTAGNETKNILACSIFNNAFTTVCADGQYIIDTDHPLEDGSGTFSNELSTGAQLSVSALQQAIVNMKYTVDGRNKNMLINPRYLVVPTALEATAEKILSKGGEPFTADNTKNIVADKGLQLVTLPWLTSSTAWFLVQDSVNSISHPLVMVDRKQMETDVDYDFKKSNAMLVRAYMRCVFGAIGAGRGLYGSLGA